VVIIMQIGVVNGISGIKTGVLCVVTGLKMSVYHLVYV